MALIARLVIFLSFSIKLLIFHLESVKTIRGGSFLSPDTRSECFLRGVKFLAENLRGMKISREIIRGMKISREIIRGMKIFPFQEYQGCEMIRGVKSYHARSNKGYEMFEGT